MIMTLFFFVLFFQRIMTLFSCFVFSKDYETLICCICCIQGQIKTVFLFVLFVERDKTLFCCFVLLLQAQRKTVFLLVFVKRYETLFCFLKIVFFLVFVKIYKRCFVFSKLCFCLCLSLLFFQGKKKKHFVVSFSQKYIIRCPCYVGGVIMLSCSVAQLLDHCYLIVASSWPPLPLCPI